MHVFLTGQVQVGKSTLIRRVLTAHPAWSVGGFRSVTCLGDVPGAVGGVYLLSASEPSPVYGPENRVGIRWGERGAEAFPSVFDTMGLDLLSDTQGRDLLLMDELGFLEQNAPLFSQRVLRLLEGPIPILGVVKPRGTPLLNAVRAHSRTEILEVTPENREGLFPRLQEKVTTSVAARRAFLSAPSCGGAVLRREQDRWETLLIRYWDGHQSFPKGRMEPGEEETTCALREIWEETGVRAALEPGFRMRIPSALKEDTGGVVCFVAHYLEGLPLPQLEEVASVAWVPLSQAAGAMRFDQDRAFFRAVADLYPD